MSIRQVVLSAFTNFQAQMEIPIFKLKWRVSMTLKGWLVVTATAVGIGLLVNSAEAASVGSLNGLKPAGDVDKVFFRCWFGCPYYGYPYYHYRPYYYSYYRYPYYGYYRPYRYYRAYPAYSYYPARYRWRWWW
jgi:hypothetical protein